MQNRMMAWMIDKIRAGWTPPNDRRQVPDRVLRKPANVGEGIHTEVEPVSRFIIARKTNALTTECQITARNPRCSAPSRATLRARTARVWCTSFICPLTRDAPWNDPHLLRLELPLPPHARRSVTMDNGTQRCTTTTSLSLGGTWTRTSLTLHRTATQEPTNTTTLESDAAYPHTPTSEP